MTIGIIPAAGRAVRIGGIPKMLLPVSEGTLIDVMRNRMWRVEHLRGYLTGVHPENYDLLGAYHLNTIIYQVETQTMSETVLLAQPHVTDGEWVLFGMPDTYFEYEPVFEILQTQLGQGADAAAALFHVRPEQRSKLGMCNSQNGVLLRVVDKPAETDLEWAWGALAWKPAFWQYIHPEDPHVGYALPRALDAGLYVRGVHMPGGYWDCGTSDEYFALIRHLTGEKVEA